MTLINKQYDFSHHYQAEPIYLRTYKKYRMEFLDSHMTAFAMLAVRWVLGTLLLFQAFDKIFTVGLSSFNATIVDGLKKSKLPKGFILFSGTVSSYIELVGSIMLILGVFLPLVYPILALNLLMVSIGFSYMKPMWDMNIFFPRFVLLIFLMSIPSVLDIYSLDAFMNSYG